MWSYDNFTKRVVRLIVNLGSVLRQNTTTDLTITLTIFLRLNESSACVEEGRPVFDSAIPKQNFTLQNPFFLIIFTYFWISPVTFLYPIKTKRVHCILKEISPKTIGFLMRQKKSHDHTQNGRRHFNVCVPSREKL